MLVSLVRFAGDARTPTGHYVVHGGANRLYGEFQMCEGPVVSMYQGDPADGTTGRYVRD